MAVRENCTEVVQILLDNKADVNHMNPHGGTPLFEAVDKGYFHVSVTLNHLETKRFLAFGSYLYWMDPGFCLHVRRYFRPRFNFLRSNYTCTT